MSAAQHDDQQRLSLRPLISTSAPAPDPKCQQRLAPSSSVQQFVAVPASLPSASICSRTCRDQCTPQSLDLSYRYRECSWPQLTWPRLLLHLLRCWVHTG
jgi:hypothetical protein